VGDRTHTSRKKKKSSYLKLTRVNGLAYKPDLSHTSLLRPFEEANRHSPNPLEITPNPSAQTNDAKWNNQGEEVPLAHRTKEKKGRQRKTKELPSEGRSRKRGGSGLGKKEKTIGFYQGKKTFLDLRPSLRWGQLSTSTSGGQKKQNPKKK